MLRLVLLFKGTFLLFLFFSHSARGNDLGKSIYSDYAIFRISDRVFFKSDFKHIKEKILSLDCMYPDSLLLKSLRLDGDEKNKIPFFPKRNEKFSRSLMAFLDKLILLKKVHIFIDKNLEKLPSLKNGKKFEECLKGKAFRTQEFKDILKIETFLKNRFEGKTQASLTVQKDALKKKYPNWKKEKVALEMKKIEEKENLRSVNLFISSLDKKMNHELFY